MLKKGVLVADGDVAALAETCSIGLTASNYCN